MPVQITLTLLKPGTAVSFCVAAEVPGGSTVFAVGQAFSETAVFGVPLKALEFSNSCGKCVCVCVCVCVCE